MVALSNTGSAEVVSWKVANERVYMPLERVLYEESSKLRFAPQVYGELMCD